MQLGITLILGARDKPRHQQKCQDKTDSFTRVTLLTEMAMRLKNEFDT